MSDQTKQPKPVILTLKDGQVIQFIQGEYPDLEDNRLIEFLDIIFEDWEPEGYTPSLDLAMAEEAQKWLGGEIQAEIESEPGVIY